MSDTYIEGVNKDSDRQIDGSLLAGDVPVIEQAWKEAPKWVMDDVLLDVSLSYDEAKKKSVEIRNYYTRKAFATVRKGGQVCIILFGGWPEYQVEEVKSSLPVKKEVAGAANT